jgi:tetratricopeptide (TPR) repeat protein
VGPIAAGPARGVAYRELHRHREARDLFDQARTALPASFRRDHGRWAAGLALACAHDGDLAAALTAGWQAITIALDTGSVYTIADLRSMRQVLDRQQADPVILDELDQALPEIIGPARR